MDTIGVNNYTGDHGDVIGGFTALIKEYELHPITVRCRPLSGKLPLQTAATLD
jgi:hypothetical protein